MTHQLGLYSSEAILIKLLVGGVSLGDAPSILLLSLVTRFKLNSTLFGKQLMGEVAYQPTRCYDWTAMLSRIFA